jgi:hypothetical protein
MEIVAIHSWKFYFYSDLIEMKEIQTEIIFLDEFKKK